MFSIFCSSFVSHVRNIVVYMYFSHLKIRTLGDGADKSSWSQNKEEEEEVGYRQQYRNADTDLISHQRNSHATRTAHVAGGD